MAEIVILTGMALEVWIPQRAIGAYQLAFYLRAHNISCQVIDFALNLDSNSIAQALNKYVTSDTRVVGISTTFMSIPVLSAHRLLNDVLSLKDLYPTIKLVLGGTTADVANESLFNRFDRTFYSYAEDEFLQYCAKPNTLLAMAPSAPFNIETLQHRFIDEDNIIEGESLPIEISRGCMFSCSFCAFRYNGKSKLDYVRDAKLVVEEMQYNYDKFGTTNYFFLDDTFNDNNDKLIALHAEITKLPFRIRFVAYIRIDLLYKHRDIQLTLLDEMGIVACQFGIETFNPPSAKAIGKWDKPDIIQNFLRELINLWPNKALHCSFIIGLPFDTRESIEKTFEFCKNTPEIAFAFHGLFINTKSTVDKSKFEKDPGKHGYKFDSTGAWYTDILTQAEAKALTEKYNNYLARTNFYKQSLRSWDVIAASSLIPFDTVIESRKTAALIPNIRELKTEFIKSYKAKLLS